MKLRKNKKILVAVAMVLMIALVAGMGAMTYSRYITSTTTGEQTATAAKWGFVVTVDADNLFGSDYKKDGANAVAKVDGTGDLVVNGTGDAKVVAPGTKGSMTISITGSAEVNARLTITADSIQEIYYKSTDANVDDYYPVRWTITDGGSLNETGTLEEVIAALTGTSTVLAAGVTQNVTYTLSWEWALETAGTNSLNGTNRNVEDTLIGFKAAGKTWEDINGKNVGTFQIGDTKEVDTDYASSTAIKTTMSFSLVVSVEQTQEAAA